MGRIGVPNPTKEEAAATARMAYEYREKGLEWAEVAKLLDLSNGSSACNAAARHEATLSFEDKYGAKRYKSPVNGGDDE